MPHYPGEHQKLESVAIHSELGGFAANTATWLAPLVHGVRLIGAVGDNTVGRLCRAWLERAGVDHTCVETIAGQQTSRASCWVVGAHKHIVTRREPSVRRQDELRPHADLVFLNPEELRAVFGLTLDRLDPVAPKTVAAKPGGTAVITHGATAVICASATDGAHSFPVTALERIVDRTGGGHAFDASFIAG